MVYFAEDLIGKYRYLGTLIIYSILKIILKEREERKQQRLQENTVSPEADDTQDVESGGDDLALEQGEPLVTQFFWVCVKESFSGATVQQTTWNSASLWPLCGKSKATLNPENADVFRLQT